MPWLKLDDAMGHHRKTRRLLRGGRNGSGLASFGLHALALLHCSEYLTDGFVEREFVEETLDDAKVRGTARDSLVSALVNAGQWESVPGGWKVHDYLHHNPARAEVEEARAREREKKSKAGKKGAAVRWGSGSEVAPASGSAMAPATDVPGDSHGPVPSRPVPSVTPKPPEGDSAGEQVQQLFAYWQKQCGHPQAKLTGERRRKTEARLKDGYTVEQIRKGIDGAAVGAYVDENGRRFDDLELICRNGSKLESFIARAGGGGSAPGAPRSLDEFRKKAWPDIYGDKGAA